MSRASCRSVMASTAMAMAMKGKSGLRGGFFLRAADIAVEGALLGVGFGFLQSLDQVE